MKQTALSVIAIVCALIAISVSMLGWKNNGNDELLKRIDDEILKVQESANRHNMSQDKAIVGLIQDMQKLKESPKQ